MRKFKVGMFLVGALFAIAWASPASADTVYTYTGDPFTTFGGSYACPPVCNITGSFTVAQPFAANLAYSNVGFTPPSYSFTDGLNVFSSSSPSPFTSYTPSFAVGTDALGNIVEWAVEFDAGTYPNLTHIFYTCNEPFCAVNPNNWTTDLTGSGPSLTPTNYAESYLQGGTWSSASTAVPEPSSLLLLGTGLLALMGLAWRRNATSGPVLS